MRDESAIRHKFKQVCFRHLKKILRANFRKQPHTCKFNRMTPVGGDPTHQVGYCNHPDAVGKVLCDTRVDGCLESAQVCRRWIARQEKERIKRAFYDLVESKDRGRIASEYPDIAALLWVMDEVDLSKDFSEIDTELDQIPDEEFWH